MSLYRLFRLLRSIIDPRSYLHFIKIMNYYNYSHVIQLRKANIGKRVRVSPNVCFNHAERIIIGDGAHIGARSYLWAGAKTSSIKIGKNTLLAPGVMMFASNYDFRNGSPIKKQEKIEKDIVIGNDVWIGAGSIIVAGVSIGDGTIIGAGSVVTTSIPDGVVAVGVPAKIVGMRKNEK